MFVSNLSGCGFELHCSDFGYFQSKWEKVNTTIELCIFELVQVPNFNWNWHLWYLEQICPKKIFLEENRKREDQLWIQHILISLGTKFQPKLKFWFFGPNLLKKGISHWKKIKVNFTIEFCRFKFSLGTKFLLELTILIFWANYAQMCRNTIIGFCIFKLV